MIFRFFSTFSLHHNDYLAPIEPKDRDIVQVVQTIQTDVLNFRFSLIFVQIWQTNPITAHITFTIAKRICYLVFKN